MKTCFTADVKMMWNYIMKYVAQLVVGSCLGQIHALQERRASDFSKRIEAFED